MSGKKHFPSSTTISINNQVEDENLGARELSNTQSEVVLPHIGITE